MAQFILVHGAGHGGWCWERIAPLLTARGHKVEAPDLPGLGADATPPACVSLSSNVQVIARLLDARAEPAILVGHSLGGITIGAVAEARRKRVSALVYLTAIMPPNGRTGRDMTLTEPDALIRRAIEMSGDGSTYTFARAHVPTLFYNDVPPEDRFRAIERLRPQPTAISATPMSLTDERYGSVPRWYIECTRDNAISIDLQRRMQAALPCRSITMDCGHSPFYSHPDELADHLDSIARA